MTTQKVEKRWRDHVYASRNKENKSSKNNHWYNAIRYYGPENFEVRTIFTCYDEKTLNEAEIFFIALFEATNPDLGYNQTSGGKFGRITEEANERRKQSLKGHPTSEETKRRISKARTGQKASPETIEILKNVPHPGRPHTEESKRRISEAKKGYVPTPERRKHQSEVLTGRTYPERQGIPVPQEMRDRISESMKGQNTGPRSEETKAAMRAGWEKRRGKPTSRKGEKKTPEQIAATREGKRKAKLRREQEALDKHNQPVVE